MATQSIILIGVTATCNSNAASHIKAKLRFSNYRLAKEIKVSESTIKRTFDLNTIPRLDLIYKIENHLLSSKKK